MRRDEFILWNYDTQFKIYYDMTPNEELWVSVDKYACNVEYYRMKSTDLSEAFRFIADEIGQSLDYVLDHVEVCYKTESEDIDA